MSSAQLNLIKVKLNKVLIKSPLSLVNVEIWYCGYNWNDNLSNEIQPLHISIFVVSSLTTLKHMFSIGVSGFSSKNPSCFVSTYHFNAESIAQQSALQILLGIGSFFNGIGTFYSFPSRTSTQHGRTKQWT